MVTLLCQGGMAIDFLTVVRIETLCAFYILILILENYLLSTNVCIRDGQEFGELPVCAGCQCCTDLCTCMYLLPY